MKGLSLNVLYNNCVNIVNIILYYRIQTTCVIRPTSNYNKQHQSKRRHKKNGIIGREGDAGVWVCAVIG